MFWVIIRVALAVERHLSCALLASERYFTYLPRTGGDHVGAQQLMVESTTVPSRRDVGWKGSLHRTRPCAEWHAPHCVRRVLTPLLKFSAALVYTFA